MQLRNDDLIVGTTTNLGWRSCVRGVIWLREVLKEVRRPRLVDKAQTCFDKYITQYTYLNRGLTVLISFHTTSLPSCEECNPPLLFFFFISMLFLHRFITVLDLPSWSWRKAVRPVEWIITLIGTLCLALLPWADSSYGNKRSTCLGKKKIKAGTNGFESQAGSLYRDVDLLLALSSVVFFQSTSTLYLKAETAQKTVTEKFS